MNFSRSNINKILSIPLFLVGFLLSWVVPRDARSWVFGSGIGVGEGALPVALEVQRRFPSHRITWVVNNGSEAEQAQQLGFDAVEKRSFGSFWRTLRAGHIVVTHGHGDVNRFGVFRGEVTHLIHGAPLKRLHLDSAITMTFAGPNWVASILKKMYLAGSKEISLFVAGSPVAADRLRSAYRVLPGKVKVLGDPRDDIIATQLTQPHRITEVREKLLEQIGVNSASYGESEPPRIILFAPTWRDGQSDPQIPSPDEIDSIQRLLEVHNAHLLIRSHPLGAGEYASMLSDRVHLFGQNEAREITPLLAGVDLLITDYSSVAIDYALFERPILWFAPDLESYMNTRGLYEPLEVTAVGKIAHTWAATALRIDDLLTQGSVHHRIAVNDAQQLKRRFHAFPEGGAAQRVCTEILLLSEPDRSRVPDNAVYFESFYGSQVACNPAALDQTIAELHPEVPRYWAVVSESTSVPEGAIPVLVGSPEWAAVRRRARLLIVNDWLRFGFARRPGQTVLQTWHGTMLKHLALGRPNVNLRTRLAIRRESRRWSLLLSQNAHSTEQFRQSYAFTGEILELGYPRADALANSLAGEQRSPVLVASAKRRLGVPEGSRVLSYAPTWRDQSSSIVNDINVEALAAELGPDWVVVARAHSRSQNSGGYSSGARNVIDASRHPDINDVILAADLFVTDYSSAMFDASVAHVPTAFFVPDIAQYRDIDRGFTFEFEATAPGPLCNTREEIVQIAHEVEKFGLSAPWVTEYDAAARAFRETFAPHDTGEASLKVVRALEAAGALPNDSASA